VHPKCLTASVSLLVARCSLIQSSPTITSNSERCNGTGEELSLAYISRAQRALHATPTGRDGGGAAIRAELLERYGFVCDCDICAKASCFDLLSTQLIQRAILPKLDVRSVAMFAATCSLHRQLAKGRGALETEPTIRFK
jgi:hypothetical protein